MLELSSRKAKNYYPFVWRDFLASQVCFSSTLILKGVLFFNIMNIASAKQYTKLEIVHVERAIVQNLVASCCRL